MSYAEDSQDYMILVGVLVGMVLVAFLLLTMMSTLRVNHHEDGITKRAKYQACQAIDNEASRIVCINGWRG